MPEFFDSGNTGHSPVTAAGNAQTSATIWKSGGGSLLLDGTGDYLTIGDNADWQLGGGSGAFTIEAWVRFAGTPASGYYSGICAQNQDGNNYWTFALHNSAGTLRLAFVHQSSGVNTIERYYNWTPSLNTWYHLALVRDGNNFDFYINGTKASGTVSDSDSVNNLTSVLYIGTVGAAAHYFNGYIDELRISDVARYTVNFTPSVLFTSDSNTKLLLHLDGFEAIETDEGGAGDAVDAQYDSVSIADQAGAQDVIDGMDFSGELADQAGADDLSTVLIEINEALADQAGAGDSVVGSEEDYGDESDQAGAGDGSDALNWTEWLRTNRDLAITRYYMTLTGAADGVDDIEIPISSFQARKRTGYSTYLSAVVPGVAYADAIAARANGEIVIEMAYLIDGEESLREEILRADLEQINPQEGPSSRSIVLIGHKTQTFVAKVSGLVDPIYRYHADGRVGYRFAVPDLWLNPGDTAQVGDDEFTVDQVVYIVAASGGQTVMEVQE